MKRKMVEYSKEDGLTIRDWAAAGVLVSIFLVGVLFGIVL